MTIVTQVPCGTEPVIISGQFLDLGHVPASDKA